MTLGSKRSGRAAGRMALALVASGVALSACASRPYATLVPVERSVPGAHKVDMLVATTRAPSTVPGVVFSGDRGPELSLENIIVSIPPDGARKAGEVVYPRPSAPDPAREFVALRIDPMSQKDSDRWFQQRKSPSGRLLIFVHGFNSSYEEAVFRFAQISYDSGADAAPILFTWPSQGSIFGYLYDRESANYSRSSLEKVIEAAAARKDVTEITIMAHSMGSWLTMEALRQIAIRKGSLPRKLGHVVLASPDLDVDVFHEQLDEIGPDQSRITIFTSQDDRALLVSRRLAGGVQRLGAVDLTKPDVQAAFAQRGITVVDLTSIRTGDSLNHTKFAQSAEVVQAIGRRLIAGQKVSEGSPGLGETLGAAAIGTAQGVGSAVNAAVNAPAAIVDPGARQRFGRSIEDVGRNIGGSLQTVTGN
ncbi:alpha/beta hydrolase [Aureimonas sp. AU40]|uniref:alpha/beta hydrolase n=1 Tax=Aureimonas sp. AU40 TaxID=1637747 RepID=UPI000785F2E4|nr:alpha/beta hydrolase [Aureimonas sp. AU40]